MQQQVGDLVRTAAMRSRPISLPVPAADVFAHFLSTWTSRYEAARCGLRRRGSHNGTPFVANAALLAWASAGLSVWVAMRVTRGPLL